MTNLKPGHIPNPPTYSRRVAFTFEEVASSCATIWTHSWPLADVGKDTSCWLKGRLATEDKH